VLSEIVVRSAADRRAFLLRRLHSLSGVVPVGAFLCEHLWTNASALRGASAFTRAVEDIQRLPALWALELFGVFLPLAFHALYGVKIALEGRPNVVAYPYARNWLYVAQRATGALTLAFVVFHLCEYRVRKWLFGLGVASFHSELSARLSSTSAGVPWLAFFYLVGLGAAVFHFANGLWGFLASWGVLVTRRAQARARWGAFALGAALFGMGATTVLHFATGAPTFAGPPDRPAGPPAEKCAGDDPK
jgi:succinate dehydrogenase/fumarate reductase cytochrome b subunit (b558 family)